MPVLVSVLIVSFQKREQSVCSLLKSDEEKDFLCMSRLRTGNDPVTFDIHVTFGANGDSFSRSILSCIFLIRSVVKPKPTLKLFLSTDMCSFTLIMMFSLVTAYALDVRVFSNNTQIKL